MTVVARQLWAMQVGGNGLVAKFDLQMSQGACDPDYG
jgi:hypothetical protein